MKKKLKKFIKNKDKVAALVLGLIVLLIALTNIKPETWFIGWDAVMQEFNYGINIERHLTSTWQEYQGLGLLGGMGHAADLPRLIIQYPLSLILPNNYIRYAYIFIALYLGALGLYFLSKYILRKIDKDHKNSNKHALIAFCAALFFIFNQGTLQTFYAPMLVFITQWAALPWLFYSFFNAIETSNKKYYLLFTIATFFGAQMAYVPTLFLVYILSISLAGLIILYTNAKKGKAKKTFFEILTLGLITIILNLFWLVPFGYFYLSGGSKTVIDSSINQIFSEEIFNRNRARGTAADVPLIRGYLYDTYDFYQEPNEFRPMLQPWLDHFSIGWTEAIGYICFGIIILGVVYILRKKNHYGLIFVILFFLSLFLLSASNPPLGFIFDWLRENSSIFREAFRFPYTKTAQLATMIYALLFSVGILLIDKSLKKLIKSSQIELIVLSVAFFLLVYALPMFSGNLLFQELKVKIPDEYFQMFEWFEEQPQEPRIANIPQADLMNWYVHDWGYRGTGFLWYGLRQPLLDRSFDPWSSNNSKYYDEMMTALYKKDSSKVAKVMEKYNIGWLLYDRSLRINWNDQKSNTSNYDDQIIPEILSNNDFELSETFGDNLKVIAYKPVVEDPGNIEYFSEISGVENYIESNKTGPFKEVSEKDTLYEEDHINIRTSVYADEGDKLEIPDYFVSGEILLNEIHAKLDSGNLYIQIKPKLPEITVNDNLTYSGNTQNKTIAIDIENYILTTDLSSVKINKNNLTSSFQKIGTIFSKNNESIKISRRSKIYKCQNENLSSAGDNALTCPLNHGHKADLLIVEFNYKTNELFFPSVCIKTSRSSKCIDPIGEKPLNTAIKEKESYSNVFNINSQAFTTNISIPKNGGEKTLQITNASLITYTHYKEISIETAPRKQTFSLNEGHNKINFKYPIVSDSPLGYQTNLKEVAQRGNKNCGGQGINPAEQIYKIEEIDGVLDMYSQNAEVCSLLWVNHKLPLKYNYLLNIDYNHNFGYPIETRVYNKHFGFNFDRFMLNPEDETRNIFIDSSAEDGQGLEVTTHLLSRGRFPNNSSIQAVSLQYFPKNFLDGIQVSDSARYLYEKRGGNSINNTRINPYLYIINNPQPGYYSNNQSYETGWVAITNTFEILKLKELDNWTNVWEIKNTENVNSLYIVYYPQVLQFAAIVSLGMATCLLIFEEYRRRKNLKKQK